LYSTQNLADTKIRIMVPANKRMGRGFICGINHIMPAR
jgi:hypothetical protein